FCVQAEDGIRDRNVTGVQTCALPISGCIIDVLWSRRLILDRLDESITHKIVHAAVTRTFGLLFVASPQLRVKFILIFIKFLPLRSEERRVGKEGSSSSSPA